MFYYLSFLRPPPVQAHPSQPVLITPQIANDLRTELDPRELDIYYSWLPSAQGSLSNSLSDNHAAAFTKLTTWREANAYKEVPVPPPRAVRDGHYWRLLLSTRRDRGMVDFAISESSWGKEPFPVLSMPILFTAHPVARIGKSLFGTKQEKIERMFSLPAIDDLATPSTVKMREQLSFDLDKKIWDSGVGLSYWLVSLARDKSQAPELARLLFHCEKCDIVELGTGTGLVSIVVAALLSKRAKPLESKVIATDLPTALEVIEHNISVFVSDGPSVRPEARVLDWDQANVPSELEGGVDLIIMADVTYNTSSFPSLISTLARLSRLRRTPPFVLLAYKERDTEERTLWGMARDIGLELGEVARIGGAGGAPIEIYIGQFRRA